MHAYLDNSATTRPTDGVISDMARAMSDDFFNPSALYAPALSPEKMMNACREKILRSVNAKNARVVFTSGGTESNNIAILGHKPVKHTSARVAVTAVEHPSVLEPARTLAVRGIETVVLNVNTSGVLDIEQLTRELENGLTLLCCMHVNNETGAINDIHSISETVKRVSPDTLIHVDGVQGFLHEEIDFSLIDSYSISGHKICGPKGIGALVLSSRSRPTSLVHGGGQENDLRSGTENTYGICGLSRAINDLSAIEGAHEKMLKNKLLLAKLLTEHSQDIVINGPSPEVGACHILNVSFMGVGGEVMLHAMEEENVLASTGAACSSKKRHYSRVLTAMGISAERAECAVRFSLSPFTETAEIEYAAEVALKKYDLHKRFRRR